MHWYRRHIRLKPMARGLHLITSSVLDAIPEMATIQCGILHVFIQHTSASITLTENADPDVLVDMETSMSAIVPENLPFAHNLEGPDDMPAHVKSSLLGSSITIPIENGRLCLGTWQGICLCEHRNRASARSLVLTAYGEGA
jgi:secondary thiamine-phosphate synthase enzyme